MLAWTNLETKLISPFAIRFTQERIRTSFRDGHEVEESFSGITTRAGIGDYDLVLCSPFPPIEIVRWRPPVCYRHAQEQHESHWFSLDNRRLYCLQRAAAAHWPLSVAVVVHVLYYVDPDAIERKYDSSSIGATVSLTLSRQDSPTGCWSWKENVSMDLPSARQAMSRISEECRFSSVCHLSDLTGLRISWQTRTVAAAREHGFRFVRQAVAAMRRVATRFSKSQWFPARGLRVFGALVFGKVARYLWAGQETTLLATGIPEGFDQDQLVGLWPHNVWGYNMLYLPIILDERRHKGYVFLNFETEQQADKFQVAWAGHKLSGSEFTLQFSKANVQGLTANLQRFHARKTKNIRNQKYKPAVFSAAGRLKW